MPSQSTPTPPPRGAIAFLVFFASTLFALSCKNEGHAPRTIAPATARAEHPRPDLRRDTFISLNSTWQFAYDPDDIGLEERWFEPRRTRPYTETVQIPFAWESPLSGLVPPHEGPYGLNLVNYKKYRGVAWYRLELAAPPEPEPGASWHIVFGAVDFAANVYLDGVEVARHEGGYEPFPVELSSHLGDARSIVLVVRVEDIGDLDRTYTQPVGKQGTLWYTQTSGIWQSVYLEQRPAVHVTSYRVVAPPDEASARISVRLSRATAGARIRARAALENARDVSLGEVEVSFDGDVATFDLPLSEVHAWEPDAPVLHALDLEVIAEGATDVVHAYFGRTRVETAWMPGHSPSDAVAPQEQYQSIFVNGTPRYLRCVLDQAYWPDGIMTAPSIDALRRDIELIRSLGFNCVRMHAKVEEPLAYRLFDEAGLFVYYDFVPLDARANNDGPGFLGRHRFEAAMRAAIERDANHPSIVAWTVFNENWGLGNGSIGSYAPIAGRPELVEWVRSMVDLAAQLDPTRPIDDNSAGGLVNVYEHVGGTLQSFHYYTDDVPHFRDFLAAEDAKVFPGSSENFVGGSTQIGAPWILSEIASFSFVGTQTEEAYCALWGLINETRRRPKIRGYVVTQLTDVEFELNGLATYDRTRSSLLCERDGLRVADLFSGDFVAFDDLPDRVLAAGSTVAFSLAYSDVNARAAHDVRVALRFASDSATASTTIAVEPQSTTSVVLELAAPNMLGRVGVIAEVFAENGTRIAANRIEAVVE